MTFGPGPQAVLACLCVPAHGIPAGSPFCSRAPGAILLSLQLPSKQELPPGRETHKPGPGSLPKMQGHHDCPCVPCLGKGFRGVLLSPSVLVAVLEAPWWSARSTRCHVL